MSAEPEKQPTIVEELATALCEQWACAFNYAGNYGDAEAQAALQQDWDESLKPLLERAGHRCWEEKS